MNEYYKRHTIDYGARPVGTNKWKPIARIAWNEGNLVRVRTFMETDFELTFATEREAKSYAREFARKWIDDGKPT